MASESFVVNEGVVLHAEIAAPMESETYRGGGQVSWEVFLPLALREAS
jgi:hypothetical protein